MFRSWWRRQVAQSMGCLMLMAFFPLILVVMLKLAAWLQATVPWLLVLVGLVLLARLVARYRGR